ncbi:MAG: SAM-dependent DNA methyltransferase [Bacteroidales bacterium]|nr:SAM-dependent DNA methyltransferase [Bacteroidales bacterium]
MRKTDTDLPDLQRQVKSKERVAAHGEVFTAQREINAMLDLVKQETERIDSRFLEPACGDGNFLIDILRRKMAVVESNRKKTRSEFERDACQAVSSLYGIEILEDNTKLCRKRLFDFVKERYVAHFPDADVSENEFLKSIRFLLEKNIIWGDALTYRTVGVAQQPIIFSEWTFSDTMVSRCDFLFDFLVEKTHQYSLFDENGEKQQFDQVVNAFPPIHYIKLYTYGD